MQGRMAKMMNNNMFNMDRSQFMQFSKMLNTIYDEYAFLTDEDYNRIDEIDNEIMEIDKSLYSIITGENLVENSLSQNVESEENTISDLLGQVKANISNPYLKFFCEIGRIVDDVVHNRISTDTPVKEMISKKMSPEVLLSSRKILIIERDDLMKTAKERMKKNNPEQYKVMQEMITQQRLQMKNGNFDLMSILGM